MKCGEIELEEWSPDPEIWSLENSSERGICACFRLGDVTVCCQEKAGFSSCLDGLIRRRRNGDYIPFLHLAEI